jgi:hypothetical protein
MSPFLEKLHAGAHSVTWRFLTKGPWGPSQYVILQSGTKDISFHLLLIDSCSWHIQKAADICNYTVPKLTLNGSVESIPININGLKMKVYSNFVDEC